MRMYIWDVNMASVYSFARLGEQCAYHIVAGIPGPEIKGFRVIPTDSRGFLDRTIDTHIKFTQEFVGLHHAAVGMPPAEQNPSIILNTVCKHSRARVRWSWTPSGQGEAWSSGK